MRIAGGTALLLFTAATPAMATGGFDCRPISGTGPILHIAIGHAISTTPFLITLTEGGRLLSTAGNEAPLVIGQSWIDNQYLWLDLVDAQATRVEVRLRATFQPRLRGRPFVGTMIRNGRTYRVRCIEA